MATMSEVRYGTDERGNSKTRPGCPDDDGDMAADTLSPAVESATATVIPPKRLLRACALPLLMAADDGRGRVVAVRQFVKDWAASDNSRRATMISEEPQRYRYWHRFAERRFDIAKIASVVHGLCDRDGMPVPAWVMRHRSPRPIALTGTRLPQSKWAEWLREAAPSVCAFHDVWFVPTMLDDYRVHGFR